MNDAVEVFWNESFAEFKEANPLFISEVLQVLLLEALSFRLFTRSITEDRMVRYL